MGFGLRTVALPLLQMCDHCWGMYGACPAICGGLAALAILLGATTSYSQSTDDLADGHGPAALIVDGVALVSPGNMRRDPATGVFEVSFAPDPSRLTEPVVDPSRTDPAAGMLRRLYARGEAAGLTETLYDNRDRGHSPLRSVSFPQISRTQYSDDPLIGSLDSNVGGHVAFNLPVIGNSSTAFVNGPLARSLGRAAVGGQVRAMQTYQLYTRNHLYVYPEHRDHDPKTGDRFFANTPYYLISQGSSYSDRPLVEALATILASYRPETRQRLEKEGLLAPTTQMVFRRSLSGYRKAETYLSSRAHPSVFDSKALQPERMVALANSIRPQDIPPVVKLRVLEDLKATPGRDYLEDNLDEVVFTTPSAIARAWRSYAHSRRMVLSAADTVDPNGRSLKFHWVVLRGDPGKVRIETGDEGRVAEITIDWHDKTDIVGGSGMSSSRVDIGVFADNGIWMSAPAFLSVTFPSFQNRVYEKASGAEEPVLVSLDYIVGPQDLYADPMLWPMANWQDTFSHDADGTQTDLTRWYSDGSSSAFAIGLTGFLKKQSFGTPIGVTHQVARRDDGRMVIEAKETP